MIVILEDLQVVKKFFRVEEAGTTPGTEVIAGTVTFMTIACIIFVNPRIISEAGVPGDAAIITTCLAAGLATMLMGVFTNYSFAHAPGMGLNAFLAFDPQYLRRVFSLGMITITLLSS